MNNSNNLIIVTFSNLYKEYLVSSQYFCPDRGYYITKEWEGGGECIYIDYNLKPKYVSGHIFGTPSLAYCFTL